VLSRGELAEVREVGEQRQRDLGADVGDVELAHDQAQVLDRAGAADAAVADETGRLVVPLGEEEVDRVLQRAGGRVVVLRGDEDEAVEGVDLLGPGQGVRLGVLTHRRRDGLVEVREVEVQEVDELVLGVGALLGDVENPLGDGFAVTARAGAAEDDRDLGHGARSPVRVRGAGWLAGLQRPARGI
jgi:hypothetical protein